MRFGCTKFQVADAHQNGSVYMGLSMSFSIEQETVCRGPFG